VIEPHLTLLIAFEQWNRIGQDTQLLRDEPYHYQGNGAQVGQEHAKVAQRTQMDGDPQSVVRAPPINEQTLVICIKLKELG